MIKTLPYTNPSPKLNGPADTNSSLRQIGPMGTNVVVKTAQAAEIAGVGYEGFRSWLKRGLLKSTGTLPKFYASSAPAEEADAKRWRWSAFGFADLCSFRLTKLMLDAGLPWDMVCTIASDETLWRTHRSPGDIRYVAAFPKSDQYTFYTLESLTADLTAETVRRDWMSLFDLHEIRKSVEFRSRVVALRVIAAYVDKIRISISGLAKIRLRQRKGLLVNQSSRSLRPIWRRSR